MNLEGLKAMIFRPKEFWTVFRNEVQCNAFDEMIQNQMKDSNVRSVWETVGILSGVRPSTGLDKECALNQSPYWSKIILDAESSIIWSNQTTALRESVDSTGFEFALPKPRIREDNSLHIELCCGEYVCWILIEKNHWFEK